MNQPSFSLVMAAVEGPAPCRRFEIGQLAAVDPLLPRRLVLGRRSQTVECPAQQRFALRHLALADQFVGGLHRAVGPGETAGRLLLHSHLAECEAPDLLEFRLRGQLFVRGEAA